MKDANKNRDPERAHKRAKADARCALLKLASWAEELRMDKEAETLLGMVRKFALLVEKLEGKASA